MQSLSECCGDTWPAAPRSGHRTLRLCLGSFRPEKILSEQHGACVPLEGYQLWPAKKSVSVFPRCIFSLSLKTGRSQSLSSSISSLNVPSPELPSLFIHSRYLWGKSLIHASPDNGPYVSLRIFSSDWQRYGRFSANLCKTCCFAVGIFHSRPDCINELAIGKIFGSITSENEDIRHSSFNFEYNYFSNHAILPNPTLNKQRHNLLFIHQSHSIIQTANVLLETLYALVGYEEIMGVVGLWGVI